MLKTASVIGLLLYFALLLLVVAREKRNRTVLDYFFASRKLPFWALSITFIASWWGAGSAISTADLAFNDGLGAFWYYGVPVLIATFAMILFSKAIRRVGYLTQSQMMEARYSKFAGKLLSILILIFMVFSAASQMVGVGHFFGSYLGIDYELAVLIGTGIVLVYSMFGGFRGVVLTDIIQFVLLLISALVVFVVACRHSGGFANIQAIALERGKPDFMNFASGIEKYIGYVLTFGCSWIIPANVWQRISATKNDGDARKMTVMSFFAYIPLYLIVVFTGMAGIGMFETLPDGGVVTAIVSQYMSPVLGAVVFVGISAAIMSTMDSLINTGAMTLSLDLRRQKPDEGDNLKFARFATFFVALIALVISLRIRSILDISWIAADVITTGVFIPLVMGFVWKRGNTTGALASMILGMIYCSYNFFIGMGVPLPAFWEQQTALQVIIGVGLSGVVYVVGSLVTPAEYKKGEAFIAKAKGQKIAPTE